MINSSKRKISYFIGHLLVIIIFSYSVYTAFYGIDFGRHWDEGTILKQTGIMVENGNFLPERYTYSSIAYLLPIITLLPEIPGFFDTKEAKTLKKVERRQALQDYLKRFTEYEPERKGSKAHTYLISTRMLYVIISYLSLFWVYITVLVWRENVFEAVLATAILALSWEINYHSRWIMPDVIVMNFVALCIMFVIIALKKNSKWFLYFSAIAAACAVGTKYNSGIILISVLIALFMGEYSFTNRNNKIQWEYFFKVLFVFSIAYFITTPGTIFDPIRFGIDFYEVITHYSDKGHGGYTVASFIDHISKLLSYLSLVAFSKYMGISLFFFILSLIGIYATIKEDSKAIWISFLSFLIIYFLFHSSQKVLIVRNTLVLFPLLAILSARGFFYLKDKFLKKNVLAALAIIPLLAVLSINVYWLYYAAGSIVHPQDPVKKLVDYIHSNKDKKIYVTSHVQKRLNNNGIKDIENVVRVIDKDTSDAVFHSLHVHGLGNPWAYPANIRNHYTWFGSFEINYDYYPSWIGENYIVVAPVKTFKLLEFDEDKKVK